MFERGDVTLYEWVPTRAASPRDRRRGPDPRPLRSLPRRAARRHHDLRAQGPLVRGAAQDAGRLPDARACPGATGPEIAPLRRAAPRASCRPARLDSRPFPRADESPSSTAATRWPSPARPTQLAQARMISHEEPIMPLKRLFERLLLRPADLEPSRGRFRGCRRLQSRRGRVDGEVILLVRVAERPRESRPGYTGLPRWQQSRRTDDGLGARRRARARSIPGWCGERPTGWCG